MIHATCIGNLGKDAESKQLDSGKIVTKFSVATKGRGKDTDTIWVNCSMWGERGKKVREFLTKGSKVAVVGTLSTHSHEGKTYVDLDVQELELLGGKKPEGAADNADDAPF